MGLGHFPFGIVGGGSLGVGGASFGDYDLLWENFSGPVAALEGRIPPLGPVFHAVGAGAASMMAGGGELNMDGAPASVGYASVQFAENAARLTSVWKTSESVPILYPATMAFLTGFNTAVDTLVHGEQQFIRLLSPASAQFISPQWYLIASTVYQTNTWYRTDFFVEENYARMFTYDDDTGALVAYEYCYDVDIQARMGPLAFYEIIDNKLRYKFVGAQSLPVGGFGGWPTLDIRKESKFPSNADGFVVGPYGGGGVSWIGANNLQINTTGAQGLGGSVPIGAVVAGGRVWFSFDVLSGGANCIVTVVPTTPGGPLGGLYNVTPDATGRYTWAVDLNVSDADASFLIAGNGSGTTINIANFHVNYNPPTSM